MHGAGDAGAGRPSARGHRPPSRRPRRSRCRAPPACGSARRGRVVAPAAAGCHRLRRGGDGHREAQDLDVAARHRPVVEAGILGVVGARGSSRTSASRQLARRAAAPRSRGPGRHSAYRRCGSAAIGAPKAPSRHHRRRPRSPCRRAARSPRRRRRWRSAGRGCSPPHSRPARAGSRWRCRRRRRRAPARGLTPIFSATR